MLAFLDHHDFKSSRRAVAVTSLAILLLAAFDISGETMKIAGLELAFNKDRLNLLLKAALVYFLFVFVIRCYISVVETTRDFTSGRIEQRLRHELEDRNKVDSKNGRIPPRFTTLSKRDEELIKKAKDAKSKPYEKLIAALNLFNFLLIEISVPLLLGSGALFQPAVLGDFIDRHLNTVIN
jgi:hypothetical protein